MAGQEKLMYKILFLGNGKQNEIGFFAKNKLKNNCNIAFFQECLWNTIMSQ